MTNHPNRSQTPVFRAAELAALLARHYQAAPVGAIAAVVDDMQRAARAAKRHAEALCSYEWAEARAPVWTRQESRAAERINARLARIRLQPVDMPAMPPHATGCDGDGYELHPAPASIRLGGDPRGPCGYLSIPGLPGDGWGDGFAIY